MIINKNEQDRNYAFDFLKVIGIVFIILHHSRLISYLKNGYMFVEMFFMISGFFLFRCIYEQKLDIKTFIKKRLNKLYLPYILAWFSLIMVFIIVKRNFSVISIYEIFMLQSIGLPSFGGGAINYPCWYISVLFYGSILIFVLMKLIDKRILNLLFAFLIIVFYSYVLFTGANIERWDYILGFIFFPFIRGICALLLGGFIYQFSKIVNKHKKYNVIILTVLSPIIILMFVNYKLDLLFILLFAILLFFISISKDNVLNNIGGYNPIKKLSSIEYYMYLNHALIITCTHAIIKKINIPNYISLFIIFISLIVFSMIMKYINSKLSNLLLKKV